MSDIQPVLDQKLTGEEMRINLFASYYLDKENAETYGNATQSAIKAFGYKMPEQYFTARKIGSKMVAKVHNLAQSVMEIHGATIPYMVEFALNEMQEAPTSKDRRGWWRELAEITGLKKIAEQQVVQIFNTTNNVQNNVNILSEEDKKKFNENFIKFINSGGEIP